MAAAPDKDLATLLEGFTWTFEKVSRETEEEKKRRVDDDGKRATKKEATATATIEEGRGAGDLKTFFLSFHLKKKTRATSTTGRRSSTASTSSTSQR